MKSVFETAEIAGLTLRNRIIRSATHEGMADAKGRPTEALARKYTALAEGGVGAIITGFAGVQQNGKAPSPGMLMLDSDDNIESFGALVERMHGLNTPIILQVAHCGRETRSKVTGEEVIAPSAIRDGVYGEDLPREMSEADINTVVDRFVDSIVRAKLAGFDGVQLHLAHGYLLSSFLSPHMNKRVDRWGGSTENRFRIVQEIMSRARRKVGSCPILAKMNGYERSKDGLTIDEAAELGRYLETAGCDAIEVSCGIFEEGFVTCRGEAVPFDMLAESYYRLRRRSRLIKAIVRPLVMRSLASPKPHELYNLDAAQRIREGVAIPVVVVGGIRRLADIRSIIEEDRCDFVSMSRPFIIEPDIVRKFEEGRQAESKCIYCNFCLAADEIRPLQCYYGRLPRS